MTDKLWHRQDDETSKAYRAFSIYRDMSPEERSYQKVAEIVYGKNTNSVRRIEKWGSKYNWVARAQAYDDYHIQQQTEKNEQLRFQHQEKQIALYDTALQRLEDALQTFRIRHVREYITEGDDPQHPDQRIRVVEVNNRIYEFRQMLNAIIDADKAKRLALGMPTSISTQSIDHSTLGDKIDNTIIFEWVDTHDNSGFEQED